MPYIPPNFNISSNLWFCDGARMPSDGPPDATDVLCQKYIAPRAAWPVSPPHAEEHWRLYHPPVQLRFAHAGWFSGPWIGWKVSCVECPAGSGQYYRPVFNDIQHEQFPNEYVLLVAVQCDATGKTFPPAGRGADVGDGIDPCGIDEGGAGGGGGGGGTGFTDTFTDTPGTALDMHTADTGETWTCTTGMEIAASGGELDVSGISGDYFGVAAYTGVIAMPMQRVSFETASSLGNGQGVGSIIRGNTLTDFAYFSFRDDGMGGYLLDYHHVVSGVDDGGTGSPQGPVTLNPSTAYNLDVTDDGTNVTANVNWSGGTIISMMLTDTSNPTFTNIGVWLFCDGSSPCFTIDELNRA